MAQGFLTTHVLNTGQGKPAEGIMITAYRIDGDGRQELAQMVTNDDGRTDQPLLPQGQFPEGAYELIFHVGSYLEKHFPEQGKPFYNEITVAFYSSDPDAHYHIPLLLSPFGYSTYRGS